jgi:hypothetical protein
VKVSEYSTINGPWVTLDYKGTVTCIANWIEVDYVKIK